MIKFAETIELDEEEAEYLGYEDGDPILMSKTHDGFIVYRKNFYEEGAKKDDSFLDDDDDLPPLVA